MRFDRAALGERLRVEIHDDRAALECISERERVILAGQRRRRRKVRGGRANLECGPGRHCHAETQKRRGKPADRTHRKLRWRSEERRVGKEWVSTCRYGW